MTKTTAIVRKKVSAPIEWLLAHVYLHKNMSLCKHILDFGCGRGFDAAHLGIKSYDPYWGPRMPPGTFDIILCTYVVCVVTPYEQVQIIKEIKSKLKPNGIAYISVRRDIKKDTPGRNCIQRAVKLSLRSIEKNSNFEIYQLLKFGG